MIFVDWISTPAHNTFNHGLFFALSLTERRVYVFSSELKIPGQQNMCTTGDSDRLRRARAVLKTCYAHRKDAIFLLTYDALYFPPLQLFCRRLYVFEHNTTPEGVGFAKHAVWQRTLFHKVTRFAQYPGQLRTLRRLRQKAVLLGSPLLPPAPVDRGTGFPIFVAPSDRLQLSELYEHASLFANHPIFVRRIPLLNSDKQARPKGLELRVVDWISPEQHLKNAKAIIVGTTSPIRGSGWFNEAIRQHIPLIITSRLAQDLFEGTFPGYPYIRPQDLKTPADLDAAIARINSALPEMGPRYIDQYNERLRRTFWETVEAQESVTR